MVYWCQWHKPENVVRYLPKGYQATWRRQLQQAYERPTYAEARATWLRLRQELLAGLRARPPAAVVLFERSWPRGDYGRLREFPELAEWLDAGYRLTAEGNGYRIYAARSDR